VKASAQGAPADTTQPSAAATAPATPSSNALTTKNLLVGGGLLAAIGTGIWALVKK
jgi:hypothetical protein